MTKHPYPNWKLLANVVGTLKNREQVKLMYKFPGSKVSIRAVSAKDIQKKIWDLFEQNVESIVIANRRNKVLFEYKREFITSNRILSSLNEYSTISEQVISDWKDMSPSTRQSWLEAVLLESIYKDECT